MVAFPIEELQSRKSIILLALILGAFLNTFDSGILAVCIPVISQTFNTTVSLAAWTILAYGLGLIMLALLSGKIYSKVGFFKGYTVSVAVFIIACIFCGFSKDIFTLSILRFIQGCGAGMLYSIGPMAIRTFIPEEKQRFSYNLVSAVPYAGILIGTPLGGLILEFFSWQYTFFFQIPVCILALLAGFSFPKLKRHSFSKGPDGLSLCFLFLSLFLLTFLLNQGDEMGWLSVPTVLLLGATIFALIIFTRRERLTKSPLFERYLFSCKTFIRRVREVSVFMGICYGVSFFVPFLLLWTFSLSPVISGFLFLIDPLVMVCVAIPGGWIIRRLSSRYIMKWGYIFLIATLSVYAGGAAFRSLELICIGLILSGISKGLYYPSSMNNVMDNLPGPYLEEGNSLYSFARAVTQIMGIAVFETIWSQIFTHKGDIKFMAGMDIGSAAALSFQTILLFSILIVIISFLFFTRSKTMNNFNEGSPGKNGDV